MERRRSFKLKLREDTKELTISWMVLGPAFLVLQLGFPIWFLACIYCWLDLELVFLRSALHGGTEVLELEAG
jgi:hypothetical protein